MTDDVNFAESLRKANVSMHGMEVNEVLNSVGSNVFFGFGEDVPVTVFNGKIDYRRAWKIWLGFAAWRITCHNEHVVGSCDDRSLILEKTPLMLGKRFQSLEILSSFMDIQFNFDDGYKIESFIYYSERNQWVLFTPDGYYPSIENETEDERDKIKQVSKTVEIINHFHKIDTAVDGLIVDRVRFNDRGFFIIFSVDLAIILYIWCWRLEKASDIYLSSSEEDRTEVQRMLLVLKGLKLERIEVANNKMDARFYFSDDYVLSTFACSKGVMNEWGLYSAPGVPIFTISPE